MQISATPWVSRPTLLSAVVAAALLEFSSPTPVEAQELVLEEVIVIARKREESLQETPIAVTAMNSDALREAQINNIADLTRNAPGLTRREGTKAANLAIRGVGTRVTDAKGEPGVGVYVDSIFIPRNDAQLVDVLNLESVQVLRGPQGTLFGKNTVGGAILLTTRKPDVEVVEGLASANFGDLDRQRLRFGISGPLIEGRLGAGILLDYAREDGYREDADTGDDYGDVDRQSLTLQFHYESDQIFTGDLMLFWGEIDENAAPVNCIGANPGTALQSLTAPGAPGPYPEECARSEALLDDEEVLMDRSPQRYTIDNQLAGLNLAWELEPFTVKSITGYLFQDNIEVANDIDATAVFTLGNEYEPLRQLAANGYSAYDQERTFFSQELQLIGDAFDDFLSYTVGAFYSSEEIDKEAGGEMVGAAGWLGFPLGDAAVVTINPSAGFRDTYIRYFDNSSAALFGQAIMNLSDTWQLTLGARYTWEEKEVDRFTYLSTESSQGVLSRQDFDALEDYIHDVAPRPDLPVASADDDWTVFSPAITLTMFTPDSWSGNTFDGGILYASLSEGFKAGGFSRFGDEFLSFDPEELITGEFGYKLDMLDSRLRLNGAFYYSKYDDIQINVTRTFPSEDPSLPAITENGITNAGEATIWGSELELSWLPLEGMFVGLNASYTNASYDEFDDQDAEGNIIDRTDEDFAYIPEWTYSLVLQYDWVTEVGTFTPRLSGYYMDEIFIGLDAVSATFDEAYVDDYTLWNFRFAWQSEDLDGLELAAYVNNLADEEYFGSGIASIDGVGAVSIAPGKQRTYGVEVHYIW